MNYYEAKVTEIIRETSDSYSFRMAVPEGYHWKAGQHTLWKFRDYDPAGDKRAERVFTIASAPEDGYLMFSTRIGEKHTQFKEILLNQLKVGDVIMVADPLGDYDMHPDEFAKTLVIAGGIGITPIRALLRHYSENNNQAHEITVLYSDSRAEFAYTSFWEEITPKMPNLAVHFITDRDEFTDRTDVFAKENGNRAEYLIAGSPGMNHAFIERLRGHGVEQKNIRTDMFMGY